MTAGSFAKPTKVAQERCVVAKRIFCCGAGTAGVFPFGFGGQPILAIGCQRASRTLKSGELLAEGLCSIPLDADRRVVVTDCHVAFCNSRGQLLVNRFTFAAFLPRLRVHHLYPLPLRYLVRGDRKRSRERDIHFINACPHPEFSGREFLHLHADGIGNGCL